MLLDDIYIYGDQTQVVAITRLNEQKLPQVVVMVGKRADSAEGSGMEAV